MLGGQPELAQPPDGVLERPDMDDLAVAEPEDGDLIDALEAAPSWGLAEPFA
jgi:hypothetical protein